MPVGTDILSRSCLAVEGTIYYVFWLVHGATFVIITKLNPGQKDFPVLAFFDLTILV
jgi:hypothetical protein